MRPVQQRCPAQNGRLNSAKEGAGHASLSSERARTEPHDAASEAGALRRVWARVSAATPADAAHGPTRRFAHALQTAARSRTHLARHADGRRLLLRHASVRAGAAPHGVACVGRRESSAQTARSARAPARRRRPHRNAQARAARGAATRRRGGTYSSGCGRRARRSSRTGRCATRVSAAASSASIRHCNAGRKRATL